MGPPKISIFGAFSWYFGVFKVDFGIFFWDVLGFFSRIFRFWDFLGDFGGIYPQIPSKSLPWLNLGRIFGAFSWNFGFFFRILVFSKISGFFFFQYFAIFGDFLKGFWVYFGI